MNNHCHHADEAGPLVKEDALDMAFDFLERGAAEVGEGRTSEASVLNVLAQTAIALADRLVSGLPAAGIVH